MRVAEAEIGAHHTTTRFKTEGEAGFTWVIG